VAPSGNPAAKGSQAYMLNARNEEKNTVFYSCSACFVNTFTLNTHVSMAYTGLTQAEYVIRNLVVAPQEYVNIYSTRRVPGRVALVNTKTKPTRGQG